MKSNVYEKLVLIFGLFVFGIGCAGSEPNKLLGEDLLLAISPNWHYYAAVKLAAEQWHEEIILEPRIFRQKGMQNVLFFVGSDCRVVSSAAVPDIDFCANILMGAGGNTHRSVEQRVSLGNISIRPADYNDRSSVGAFNVTGSSIWVCVDFLKRVTIDFPIKDELYPMIFFAVHEFGHLLGLEHSSDPTDVMNGEVSGSIITGKWRPSVKDQEMARRKSYIERRNKIVYVMM